MGGLVRYLREGLWRGNLGDRPPGRRLLDGVLRVVLHVVGSFHRNQVGIRAAGMTLVTLLSLVPLLALVSGIAEGLGFAEDLDAEVRSNLADLPDYLREPADQILALVDRTSFKALGWLGSLVLVWSALSLFTRIEEAINHAWRTVHRRPWLRRLTDFVAVVVLVPLLFLGALSLSSLLHGGGFVDDGWPWLKALYDAGLTFVPYVMLCVAFSGLYRFMPSARVRWFPAVLGGGAAAVSMLWIHGLYIHFQVGVARTNAIYATLAAIPLFLVYLQIVWTIVLLGAETSYAVQNVGSLGRSRALLDLPIHLRRRLGVALVERASANFAAGEGSTDLGALAREMDVPREWLDAILTDLTRGGVLAPVQRGDDVLPNRPPDDIDLARVLEALDGEPVPDVSERVPLRDDLAESLEHADRARADLLRKRDFGGDPSAS